MAGCANPGVAAVGKGFSAAAAGESRRRRGYRGADLEALRAAHRSGDLQRAEQGYRQLLAKGFDQPEIPEALAAIALAQNRVAEALPWLEQALLGAPESPHLLGNLGMVLVALERWPQAEDAFRAQLRLDPGADGFYGLALALQGSGDLRGSVEALEQALALEPEKRLAWSLLAEVHRARGETSLALQAYDRLLALQPNDLAVLLSQAQAQREAAEMDDCHGLLARWCQLRGRQLAATADQIAIAQALLQLDNLPPVYRSEQQLLQLRARADGLLEGLEQQVAELASAQLQQPLLLEVLLRCCGFDRAYQLEPDTAYQRRLALVLRRLLLANLPHWREERPLQPAQQPAQPFSPQRPLRLGIASTSLYRHNGAYWALGWLEPLPRDCVQLFTYDLGQPAPSDAGAERFRRLGSHRLLPMAPDSLEADLRQLQQDRLDVLLLPEVGMAPQPRLLSLLRLAPRQVTSWGHPITSGSPCIDGFLSGTLMEPADGEAHYSERLLRLPQLGFCFEPPPAVDAEARAAVAALPLPVEAARPLVGCLQTLYKYHPRYDRLWAALALECPQLQLLFIAHRQPAVTQLFAERLQRAFEAAGADFEKQVLLLPRLQERCFNALFERLDLNLDSLGWSGGNTSLRALQAGCPTLSWEAPLMRGRHTAAMLRRLDLPELILQQPEQLVPRALELLRSPETRQRLRTTLRQRSALLFNDSAASQGFAAWLLPSPSP